MMFKKFWRCLLLSDDSKNGNDNSKNVVESIKRGLLEEKPVKKSEYIFSIIANLILLYIANNLLNWNISFITDVFTQVLWIINLSIVVTILGNVMFLVYDPSWFRHLTKAVMNTFGFIVTYTLYIVFPFSFSQSYTVFAVKLALIIIMVLLVLTVAFEIFKLLFGIMYKSKT